VTGLLLAALLLAAEDPVRALSDRADALLESLYGSPGDAGILADAARLRGECLAAGATGVAEKLQGQIVYHRPQSLPDRHLYQRILVARGRIAEARKDLRDLVREMPSDCRAHQRLAALLEAEGDAAGAAEVHEAHLREHPGEAGPLSALGRLALWQLRDAERARAAAARLRAAAEGDRASPRDAAWMRGEASFLEEEAGRMERDRASVAAAEARVETWLGIASAVFAALLAGAFVATRPSPYRIDSTSPSAS